MDPRPSAPPRRDPPARSPWREAEDRRRRTGRRRTAAVLLVVYVTLVGLITLTPDSVDRGLYPHLMRGIRFLQVHGAPWFRYAMLEELANVALFVPLGLLGVLAWGVRRWWAVVLAGVALSSSVELLQGAFLPHRVASLGDVTANGAGAVVGVVVAALIAAAGRARGRSRS